MKVKTKKPSSNSNPFNDEYRCQHRTLKGRCRMLAVDPINRLCFDHARRALQVRHEADFARFLVRNSSGFQTAKGINHSLGDLYVLLAQGRISPRRASILAHICSLLLRTLPAIDTDKSPDADRDLYLCPDGQPTATEPDQEREEEVPQEEPAAQQLMEHQETPAQAPVRELSLDIEDHDEQEQLDQENEEQEDHEDQKEDREEEEAEERQERVRVRAVHQPVPPGRTPLPATIDGYIEAVTKLKLNHH